MRTEVAQIQGGNNDGRPTSPSRAAAQSSSASIACSAAVPAAKLKAPVREEAGGCSVTSTTSSLPTSSRAISSYRRGSLQSPGALPLTSEVGLGRSIEGARGTNRGGVLCASHTAS
ncbi:uncharacterized protein [Triticum aestivum]|uniref:uncharacterized protein n=1 Tax=Triticum aestivum TaxID=4565 RepID=UPI001D01371B|nr:uncharacterized protein LOC123112052 [Triticum aestivum]